MGEFELIRRYFTRPTPKAVLGVGDDCALLRPTPGMHMAISTDMLVSGRHFFADVSPYALGHKALAVNLSDMAACGARPVAFTLSLALPQADAAWLGAFAEGMFALADAHACELVGGDTTRGPLTINITIFGEVPPGQALLRSGARVGDEVWVSGSLGDAALALRALQGHIPLPDALLVKARQRLEMPSPRVALGLALRGIASAAADISDGLLGDLGHILNHSGVGAAIDVDIATQLIASCAQTAGASALQAPPLALEIQRSCVLAGGDDYELVFTAPPAQRAAVLKAGAQADVAVTRIGTITASPGVKLMDAHGATIPFAWRSFDHFAALPVG